MTRRHHLQVPRAVLLHPAQDDVRAPPVVQGDLQADSQRPAETAHTIHHEPHPPPLLRLGCEIPHPKKQGRPHRRDGQRLPPQGLGSQGPLGRRDSEVSPEEGGRGGPGLQPALEQGRVHVAELGLWSEQTARGQRCGHDPPPPKASLSVTTSWGLCMSDSGTDNPWVESKAEGVPFLASMRTWV